MMNARNATLGSTPMAAFFVGSMLGVVAGLLFAPRAGKESREMIRHTAREKYNKMQQKAMQRREAMKAKLDAVVNNTKESADNAQNKAEDMNIILDTVKPGRHTAL